MKKLIYDDNNFHSFFYYTNYFISGWQYRLQDGRKADPILLSPFSLRIENEDSHNISLRGMYYNFDIQMT